MPLATLSGHTEAVNALAFDPRGRVLASAGADRTVRLWDVFDPRQPAELATRAGPSHALFDAVAFSPDGRILASASADRTVRLWDLSDPARPDELAVLTDHTDRVYALAISPDGTSTAAGGQDRTVCRWDLDTWRVAARICAAARAISREEWAQYLPGLPYQPPCNSA